MRGGTQRPLIKGDTRHCPDSYLKEDQHGAVELGGGGQGIIGPTSPVPSSKGLRSTPSKVILGSGAPVRAAKVGSRSRELASSWVTPVDRQLFGHSVHIQGWGDRAKGLQKEGQRTDQE